MTVERQEPNPDALFQATITAELPLLAQCDDLQLDLLPSRSYLDDGRCAVKAVLRLDQLVYLVGAGATVLLERLIDPQFPPKRVLSADAARSRLQGLRQVRGTKGD